MKDWEKYEDQILGKLQEKFPNAELEKNQKLVGKFSKRNRQVDILFTGSVLGKEVIGVVECKKFSRKISVKLIDSFLGFLLDVGANIGIMITNVGYSKAAQNRADCSYPDIRLDVVKFEKLEDYEFHWDVCYNCESFHYKYSQIAWTEFYAITDVDDFISIIQQGTCDYCGSEYVKCQECMNVVNVTEQDGECSCGNVYQLEREYEKGAIVGTSILLVSHVKEHPKFVDPNQLKMLD